MGFLVSRDTLRDRVVPRLPAAIVAAGVTEVAFKLHSFILELAGFLALWSVLELTGSVIRDRLHAGPRHSEGRGGG